jgi:hypothetical protein
MSVTVLLVSSLSVTSFFESTVMLNAQNDLQAVNPGIITSTALPDTSAGVKAVPVPPPPLCVSEALV